VVSETIVSFISSILSTGHLNPAALAAVPGALACRKSSELCTAQVIIEASYHINISALEPNVDDPGHDEVAMSKA